MKTLILLIQLNGDCLEGMGYVYVGRVEVTGVKRVLKTVQVKNTRQCRPTARNNSPSISVDKLRLGYTCVMFSDNLVQLTDFIC